MEFLVGFEVNLPYGTPESDVRPWLAHGRRAEVGGARGGGRGAWGGVHGVGPGIPLMRIWWIERKLCFQERTAGAVGLPHHQ